MVPVRDTGRRANASIRQTAALSYRVRLALGKRDRAAYVLGIVARTGVWPR